VKTFTTSARLLTNEAQVGEVVEKFRDKYGAGQVKAYSREVPARFWHFVSRSSAMRLSASETSRI
jgi:hypothetical protein